MSINIIQLVRGAVKGALVAWTSANSRRLLVRLLRDEAGSYLVIFAFLTPVLIGVVGFGTEGGLWLYSQQAMQGAADSAAVAAARAYSINTSANITVQADAITAGYGFVNGTNGVTVTVNQPPKSGNYTTNQEAIEVIVKRPQNALFSSIAGLTSINIGARSVALAPQPCGVLALDPTAPGAVTVALLAGINLTGCPLFSDSNKSSSIDVLLFAEITATGPGGTVGTVGHAEEFLGTISPTPTTGDAPVTDPYLSVPLPTFTVPNSTTNAGCVPPPAGGSGSTLKPLKAYTPKTHTSVTISPGVYCYGMSFTQNTVTMNPGVYILYEGVLSMIGSTLTGNGGVTLVFTGTGTSYASMNVDAASTISLTAPTSGTTAGIVMYGDRNTPLVTGSTSGGTAYTFAFGAALNATGAVYLPRGNVTFAGIAGSTANCTLLIADTIEFVAIAGLQDQCSGVGTFSIATPGAVMLME